VDFDRAREAQRQRRLATALIVLCGGMVFVVWFSAIDLFVEDDQALSSETQTPLLTDPKNSMSECEDPSAKTTACIARRNAIETWAEVEKLTDDLMEKQVTVWATDRFAQSVQDFTDAVQGYNENRFEFASKRFSDVLDELKDLDQLSIKLLSDSVEMGWRAINQEQSAEAIDAFELALLIDPGNVEANEGYKRAAVLVDVLGLYYEGVSKEASGQLKEALSLYEKAAILDQKNTKVQSSVKNIKTKIDNANYRQAISTGLVQLGSGDAAKAKVTFQRALKMRPDSDEARSGIERSDIVIQSQEVGLLLSKASKALAEEAWEEASSHYAKALAIDPATTDAKVNKAEIDDLLSIEQEMSVLTEDPFRLSSKAVFDHADNVISRAKVLASGSPRLQGKITELSRLQGEMQTPVPLVVQSDGMTEVAIQRVGALGRFDQKIFEVLPGNYVLLGKRRGYRDVRQEMRIMPGANRLSVTIICDETI
jgi:tetratricopeptide (TPR) repeat protein